MLMLFKPIRFPFADDWLIISWNSSNKELFSRDLFQLVNGHQVALSKILLKALSYISEYNLPLISFSSYFLGLFGITLLIKSQIRLNTSRSSWAFLIASSLIAFSSKQMQNFFMPICNGWMLALFWIGIYFNLKQGVQNRTKKIAIILLSVLAPMSIGLGVIIPLAEFVQKCYEYLKSQKTIKNALRLISHLSIYVVTVMSIVLLKNSSDLNATLNPSTSVTGSALRIFQNPIDSLYFVLSLIGNIFVPASRFDHILPLFLGVIVVVIFLYIMRGSYNRELIDSVFLNQNSLMGGSIFLFILLLFRFETEAPGIAAAAPRYVTGTVVFIIGLIGLVQRHVQLSKMLALILSSIVALSVVSGVKSGEEWHSVRYEQSQKLMKCVYMESIMTNIQCTKLVKANSMSPSAAFLESELFMFQVGVINDN